MARSATHELHTPIDMAAHALVESGNFDPALSNVALAGLSAICYGIRQSSKADTLDTLKLEELFDASGTFNANTCYRGELTHVWRPGAPHVEQFNTGVSVTRAALIASRMFSALRNISDDGDYRRVELPVFGLKPARAGMMLGTDQVRGIEARVTTGHKQTESQLYTRLDFAAYHSGLRALPRSTATSLTCEIDMRQETASAEIISTWQEGPYANVRPYAGFETLDSYANLADTLLSATRAA